MWHNSLVVLTAVLTIWPAEVVRDSGIPNARSHFQWDPPNTFEQWKQRREHLRK